MGQTYEMKQNSVHFGQNYLQSYTKCSLRILAVFLWFTESCYDTGEKEGKEEKEGVNA